MQTRIIKNAVGYYLSALFLGALSTIFMTAGLILLIGAIAFEGLTNWQGIKVIIIGSGTIAISIALCIFIFVKMLPVARGLKNNEAWAIKKAEKIRLRWSFR